MEKILPFNFTPHNTTDCWHSKFIGIVLTEDKFIPWFVEKFINIFLRKEKKNGYFTSYYDWGSSASNYLYEEVFDITRIDSRVGIINTIKNSIEDNSYIFLRVILKFNENGQYTNLEKALEYITISEKLDVLVTEKAKSRLFSAMNRYNRV